jgi:hypothetical protein
MDKEDRGESNAGEIQGSATAKADEIIPPARMTLSIAAGLVVVAATAGCSSVAVLKVGMYGLFLLWGGGYLAGATGNRLLSDAKSKLVGYVLAASLLLAFVFVETCFIRYRIKQGQDDWLISLSLVPQFLQENPLSSLVGIVSTVLGGAAAYRETAKRFYYVRVETR